MFHPIRTTFMVCFETADPHKPYHGHSDGKVMVPCWFSTEPSVQESECWAWENKWRFPLIILLILLMPFLLLIGSSVICYVPKEALLGPRVLKLETFLPKQVLGSKEIRTNSSKKSDAYEKRTYPYFPPLFRWPHYFWGYLMWFKKIILIFRELFTCLNPWKNLAVIILY